MEKRSIIFRGKRVDNGEWVEGDLIQIGGGCLIYHGEKQELEAIPQEDSPCAVGFYPNEISPVIPKTVGQFTGVLHRDIEKYNKGIFDKNGMEMPRIPVYEGDIVEFKSDPSFYINAKVGDRYIIDYLGAGFFMKPISWGLKKLDAQNYIGLLPPYQTSNMSNHYEVIGNVHDNPELL